MNFAVKEQGLEAQLLGIVVRKERPQLEEQKDKLVTTIAKGLKQIIPTASYGLLFSTMTMSSIRCKVTSKAIGFSRLHHSRHRLKNFK